MLSLLLNKFEPPATFRAALFPTGRGDGWSLTSSPVELREMSGLVLLALGGRVCVIFLWCVILRPSKVMM